MAILSTFVSIKDGDLVPQEQLAGSYAFMAFIVVGLLVAIVGLIIKYFGVIRHHVIYSYDRLTLCIIRHLNRSRDYRHQLKACCHAFVASFCGIISYLGLSASFTRNENDAGNSYISRNRFYEFVGLFNFLAWFRQRYRVTTETATPPEDVNDNGGSLYVGLRLIFQDGGRFYDFQTLITLLSYVAQPYKWLR
uniref:Uncharacterized protein n=1 Tax=Amphimedon queenslandica TaxID=400682 RepID=A0A1X7SX97_AMPQE